MTDPQTTDPQQAREVFRTRFTQIMQDMAKNVQKDEKQLFVIGAIADMTTAEAKTKGWKDMKARMDEKNFNQMLTFFQDMGNDYAKNQDHQRKYACEILAVSLIARNMHDEPNMAKGDQLLDNMIEDTIKFYQENLWRYKPTDKVVN